MQEKINVTKTWLPDRRRLEEYIKRIYDSGQVTNNGPLLQELTRRLEDYLGVDNLLLVANGTLALQIAYRAVNIRGEAVTTPFSFPATVSSLAWENIRPRYADIEANTFCLDPARIEKQITPNTAGIVPVHVFGNACDTEAIEKTARKHNLKIVYDAAHAFAVNYQNQSLLNYGHAATLSFHATKLFHTMEGGAIIFKQKEHLERAQRMINFGISGPEEIAELGINAKMNEFQAAMGLCVLDDIDEIIERRRQAWIKYHESLSGRLDIPEWRADNNNCAYFPVLFENPETLKIVQYRLNEMNIFPRRYFYPSLNTVEALSPEKCKMEISENIADRILCLPLSAELASEDQDRIIECIASGTEA